MHPHIMTSHFANLCFNFCRDGPETKEWDCTDLQNKIYEVLQSADGKSIEKLSEIEILQATCSSAVFVELLDRLGK